MKYVFVDTDNGVATPAGTEDGSTGKYHTTSSWPANTARWSSLISALANATVRGVADDFTFFCQGTAEEVVSGSTTWNINGASWLSLIIQGNLSTAKWSTSEYRIRASGTQQTFCTHSSTVYDVTLLNLQIEHNGSSTTNNTAVACTSTSRTLKVGNCFVKMSGASTSQEIAVQMNASGGTLVAWNTIAQGVGTISTNSAARAFSLGSGSMSCYNCVAHNFQNGFYGTNMVIKNSAVFDTADDFFGTQTIDYCASDDGNGTNAQTSVTWANEFEDHANGDFRLKAGTTKLKDTGVSDPGSGLYSTDIAGTTRTGLWDIGAFEWVPTGLSITSVDTDNAVLAGQSQATVAGTGLASTAKFAVKRGSAIAYATDISLSGSTGGSFTAPTMTAMFSAGVRFGDVAFFAAETSGTAIASISGSITTATNWKYVNVTDLSATGSMGSLFYGNAVSLSDQVAYSSVTTRFRWPVTVSGDGYFTVNSSGSQAGDEFAYRIWDETDSTWGTEGTIEVNGGISSAEQVYAAGSLVQASLESSTLEGATLQ